MEQLSVAKLGKSHGVKGFMKMFSWSGDVDHLLNLHEAEIRFRGKIKKVVFEKMQKSGDHLLVKIQGIDTPEEAKKWVNWEIWTAREQASPLDENEYYHADLCQCSLFFENDKLGSVLSVVEGGNGELLEVKLTDGKTCLIPFLRNFIGEIDIKGNRIELLDKDVLG